MEQSLHKAQKLKRKVLELWNKNSYGVIAL